MTSTLKIGFFSLVFFLITSLSLNAQQNNKFINASIGIGYSLPYEDVNVYGSGFYAQGEYGIELLSWIDIRGYAGFIFTSNSENEFADTNPNYKAEAKSFLLGAKTRIAAPIPYFSPYFEIGIGASLGAFTTITPLTFIEKKGLLYHIPVTIGIGLGKKNNYQIEFTYYIHPSAEQFLGAAAFGFTFPID